MVGDGLMPRSMGPLVVLGNDQTARHRQITNEIAQMSAFQKIILIAPAGSTIDGLNPTECWEIRDAETNIQHLRRFSDINTLVVIDYQRAEDNRAFVSLMRSDEFSRLFKTCRHYRVTLILATCPKVKIHDPLGQHYLARRSAIEEGTYRSEDAVLVPINIQENARALVELQDG